MHRMCVTTLVYQCSSQLTTHFKPERVKTEIGSCPNRYCNTYTPEVLVSFTVLQITFLFLNFNLSLPKAMSNECGTRIQLMCGFLSEGGVCNLGSGAPDPSLAPGTQAGLLCSGRFNSV
jgi:hypothetical protein